MPISVIDAPETHTLVEAEGRRFHLIEANLLSIEPVERIVHETVEVFGRIDILVNNAGSIRREDSVNFSGKDWDEVMDINLKTTFFLSQAVARQFMTQGNGGKIITIASMLSFQSGICVRRTPPAKAVLLTCEWASQGIRRLATWPPTSPRPCVLMSNAMPKSLAVFRQNAEAIQTTWWEWLS